MPSGRVVYYYQCYDQKGKRQAAKSTGLSKKTEAVELVMKLYKDGKLIPEIKAPTFAEFSNGWWVADTCRYLKWRALHEPLAEGTINHNKNNFNFHIKNYFAKYRLDEITPEIIENWLLFMSEKGYADKAKKYVTKNSVIKKNKKQKNEIDENTGAEKNVEVGEKKLLKATTINAAFDTLKTMLGEAVRLKILKVNPCHEVKILKEQDTKRVILTKEEAHKLFTENREYNWDSSTAYKAHLLAACTGLRIGELRGLRCEYVFDDYIFICGQYGRYGYVAHTKTNENRNIPIPAMLRKELEELLNDNSGGYVFSDNCGKTPLNPDQLRKNFIKALEGIGISKKEKAERNLSFHSWRHFFNTLLRMSNIADSKVQSITGHKTMSMTNHYTHFDTRKFVEVVDVQTNLLTFNVPENQNKIIQAEIIKPEVKTTA